MAYLTAESILEHKANEVESPELGGTVLLRKLKAAEWKEWDEVHFDSEGKLKPEYEGKMLAETIIWMTCDEQGNRLFTPDQLDELNKVSDLTLRPIYKAARAFNGFDMETVAKN